MKLFFYILFSFIFKILGKLQFRIMNTPILGFFPQLKLHHIVLLKKNKNLYSIDFTPLNQGYAKTQLQLLLGKNVEGEIRLRDLNNIDINDDKQIALKWNNNSFTGKESRELTNKVYKSIKDAELKVLLYKLLYWEVKNNQTMNLYIHNCQHFSGYARNILSTSF